MYNIIFLTGHTYSGCFEDYQQQRIISDIHLEHDSMTNEYCADACCSQSHISTYMGTEVYITKTTNILTHVETKSCINRTLSKVQNVGNLTWINQTLVYISNTKADPNGVRFIQVSLYNDHSYIYLVSE